MKALATLSLLALSGLPAAAQTIQGKALVLEPGQSAVIAIDGGKPVMVDPSRLTVVDQRPAGDVMGFEFKSDEDGRGTTLVIRNGYDRFVDVDAEIHAASGRHQRTSMCVVIARGTGHELWPHPIAKIEITKFKFVGADQMRCD